MDNNSLIIGLTVALVTAVIVLARRRSSAKREEYTPTYISPSHRYPDKTTAGSGSFLFRVEDVFSITGRGTVVTGKIESGTVRTGDTVMLVRGSGHRRQVRIKGIEMFRKLLDTAKAGDNVGLLLDGLNKEDVSQGDRLVSI